MDLHREMVAHAGSVLTTHLPRNLTFYRRDGFEVAWEREVRPPGGSPYPVWGMRLARAGGLC